MHRVKVPPRSASKRKEVYGLVKGAEVARGPQWNFGNQDGGYTVTSFSLSHELPVCETGLIIVFLFFFCFCH